MNPVPMYNSTTLADRIKAVAKERGISLKVMLEELGLGSNAMSHMRHGKVPASDTLARIADYLSCSTDYLLGRTDDPILHQLDSSSSSSPL